MVWYFGIVGCLLAVLTKVPYSSPESEEYGTQSKYFQDHTLLSQELSIKVAVEEWVPHVKVDQDIYGVITISGPMANLLNLLAESLKFKYTLLRPSDGAWGIPDKNGSWNGMIGMVARNEADIALGPFGLTFSRSRVVEFSSPIIIDYYRILVSRPKAEPNPWSFISPFRSLNSLKYMEVFQPSPERADFYHRRYQLGNIKNRQKCRFSTSEKGEVWIGIIGCIFIVTLLVFSSSSLVEMYFTNPRSTSRKTGSVIGSHPTTFEGYLWSNFSAVVTQPFTWIINAWSSRIALAIFGLSILVFSKSYSSSLTSLLAVRNVFSKYEYLTDLVKDNDMHLIFEKATALVEHMSKVESGIYKDLADTSKEGRAHFLASSLLFDAAFTDVKNKKFAMLVEDVTCRKVYSDDFTKYGKCNFYLGKEKYWPLIYCMIGRKGHPFMAAINARIERLASQELYLKWLEEELPNATACLRANSKVTVKEAYGLNGMWGMFILFVAGMLFGILALAIEVFFFKCNLKK